jgi:hypothetical protein
MDDLDIKYEHLSGKTPAAKRLLAHVLGRVKTEGGGKIDLSGDRLFVEAFPRTDGGCMLYISSLESSQDADNGWLAPSDYSAMSAFRTEVFQLPSGMSKCASVVEFDDVDAFLEFYNACRGTSSPETYSYYGKIRAIIVGKAARLAREYGKVFTSTSELNKTMEHGRRLG